MPEYDGDGNEVEFKGGEKWSCKERSDEDASAEATNTLTRRYSILTSRFAHRSSQASSALSTKKAADTWTATPA